MTRSWTDHSTAMLNTLTLLYVVDVTQIQLILLATILNIILALYAIITVAFAVFVTVASLVLLGWELNVFESVIMILAVGLCVDFIIHYGVAYSLAQVSEPTRSLRTEYSIRTMTGAISVAALSTFLAGVFMLAANINAYLQLGVFLTLVMRISWTYSTFFFQSLWRVIGPQAHDGDIFACRCCKSCKKGESDMNGQENSVSAAQGHDNQVFYNDNATTQLWYESHDLYEMLLEVCMCLCVSWFIRYKSMMIKWKSMAQGLHLWKVLAYNLASHF